LYIQLDIAGSEHDPIGFLKRRNEFPEASMTSLTVKSEKVSLHRMKLDDGTDEELRLLDPPPWNGYDLKIWPGRGWSLNQEARIIPSSEDQPLFEIHGPAVVREDGKYVWYKKIPVFVNVDPPWKWLPYSPSGSWSVAPDTRFTNHGKRQLILPREPLHVIWLVDHNDRSIKVLKAGSREDLKYAAGCGYDCASAWQRYVSPQ
jgi:hypothetical protein